MELRECGKQSAEHNITVRVESYRLMERTMHQQCNSPKEVAKRLAFLLYILLFTTYLLSCVVVLARPGRTEASVALLAFSLLVGIRRAGYRRLDFKRLCESFPSGCPLDQVPEKVRDEVEELVAEFHASGIEWTRRVEIRHRLVELEEEEPDIVLAYESELKDVLVA